MFKSDQDTQLERIRKSGFISDYVRDNRAKLEDLRTEATALDFAGKWSIIGDHGYFEERTQYATTSFAEAEVSPRIILHPAPGHGDTDIAKAITLCRKLNMSLATRTGGHQYCGFSSTRPDNMQIDLSKTYPEYSYDAAKNELRCGVSHRLASWAKLNEKHGIYLPMGVCGHVHLGGHVHTGGWGMVARSHGILADHVLSFDIMLASGKKAHIVRPVAGSTTQHNDDLFYAVLGGGKGGDFGIVTHLTFEPIRDADHPNSACYEFVWFWTPDKMEGIVRRMEELTRMCAAGQIPSDYEFMLTITGAGKMNLLSDRIKQRLRKDGRIDGWFKKKLGIPVPGLIQMWMCYTNKNPATESFDPQWFESFTKDEYGGDPLVEIREPNTAISHGLANHFIMKQPREMEYPFVKRSRVTMDLPVGFHKTYAERMQKVTGLFGVELLNRQHLVSQQQIYAAGAVANSPQRAHTSYSWRDQQLAMSHDSFYDVSWYGTARKPAEAWQAENDRVFIEQGKFADADMRMFAYTFGDNDLKRVWQHYYDSPAKYKRLQAIKLTIDPTGLFSSNAFSVKPR